MGAVALREERQSLTIDGPEAIAELCSEMRFLDRESLRVVLLNCKAAVDQDRHRQPRQCQRVSRASSRSI
jgi:DNA repair protein RadC